MVYYPASCYELGEEIYEKMSIIAAMNKQLDEWLEKQFETDLTDFGDYIPCECCEAQDMDECIECPVARYNCSGTGK